ncbi:hypothetical protein [Oceanicoccus sagamiensis]|uniref:Thiolase-like protein type 1 additional C-terminal domain-containing protein n=1 Tax=Oceanicoccus sagamiensis TaxID=716816 RepID=A0A1X9N872_9GAMM|nr:hypothetical protein [Oceanicoccus sagamiensis]ARN74260.1 hypothetical protein BST96_09085 [Oceanicoccus sagamiensis]
MVSHCVTDNTPVLIGAGQYVQREATDSSPMMLAAEAAKLAITNTGADNIAAHIDTICVTRLFSDMGHLWPCPWGRSDNPPESIAQAIGASPHARIYSEMGGNQPQSQVIEFARDIAQGKREIVLMTGAEALKNQRHAERNQQELDWNEHFDLPLDDRGMGDSVVTTQEINNGLNNVLYYYSLIEQAQRHQAGRTVAQHQQFMAELLAPFSQVAANNPSAQFPGQQRAEDIRSADPINFLYSKRMIAQDSVNQSAGLILCSVAKAREMGVAESQFVYLHGMAEGTELPVSQRPDPAISPIANKVVDKALAIAQQTIADIDLIDIYSCFPCAVTAITNHLGLPTDGSKALTLTGGLPYFGGPGNNYSMHALVEAVLQLRQQPQSYALVTCNGGVLSKHASGIYSCRPSAVDWSATETSIENNLPRCEINSEPSQGNIVSYSVDFDRKGNAKAIILAETQAGERFVACTAKDDQDTAMALLQSEATGKQVIINSADNGRLNFILEHSA